MDKQKTRIGYAVLVVFLVVIAEILFLNGFQLGSKSKLDRDGAVTTGNIVPTPNQTITPLVSRATIQTYLTDIFPSLINAPYTQTQNYYFMSEERGIIESINQNSDDSITFRLTTIEDNSSFSYTINPFEQEVEIRENSTEKRISIEDLKENNSVAILWRESLSQNGSHKVQIIRLANINEKIK